jgi:hypothetical protein
MRQYYDFQNIFHFIIGYWHYTVITYRQYLDQDHRGQCFYTWVFDAGFGLDASIYSKGRELTLMLHKFLDAGAFRVVFSGSRAGFSNRSIVDTM